MINNQIPSAQYRKLFLHHFNRECVVCLGRQTDWSYCVFVKGLPGGAGGGDEDEDGHRLTMETLQALDEERGSWTHHFCWRLTSRTHRAVPDARPNGLSSLVCDYTRLSAPRLQRTDDVHLLPFLIWYKTIKAFWLYLWRIMWFFSLLKRVSWDCFGNVKKNNWRNVITGCRNPGMPHFNHWSFCLCFFLHKCHVIQCCFYLSIPLLFCIYEVISNSSVTWYFNKVL